MREIKLIPNNIAEQTIGVLAPSLLGQDISSKGSLGSPAATATGRVPVTSDVRNTYIMQLSLKLLINKGKYF